ncbi:MAG TPA: hypothetical protein VJY15_03935 [Candidatus Acidoferrum sp.]|nr:hypothetical protein [Candidatus Acidoferrum sp.]
MKLQKLAHVVVVLVFAVVGVSSLLAAAGFAWHLRTIKGPYFQTEMDLLEGIALLVAAVGLYRHDVRVRKFAVVLAALYVLACGIGLVAVPGIVSGSWFLVWLLVLLWLLSATARAQFAAGKAEAKTA